eukprot:776449-Pleurochrysis_carterae.AAC.1
MDKAGPCSSVGPPSQADVRPRSSESSLASDSATVSRSRCACISINGRNSASSGIARSTVGFSTRSSSSESSTGPGSRAPPPAKVSASSERRRYAPCRR